MKKIAVVLSGCGVFDGAEIHESVITLLALDRRGAVVDMFAPDVPQMHVVNHLNGEESQETRNVLTESARIARGSIQPLSSLDVSGYDALIFPGGFGAAKNWSDFALKGKDCRVNPEVSTVILTAVQAKKTLGFICIAPAILARVLGQNGLSATVTIGHDKETASTIEAMGAKHQPCSVDDVVVDRDMKIVTTPAYMLAQSISEVATGIEKLVDEVLAIS